MNGSKRQEFALPPSQMKILFLHAKITANVKAYIYIYIYVFFPNVKNWLYQNIKYSQYVDLPSKHVLTVSKGLFSKDMYRTEQNRVVWLLVLKLVKSDDVI